MQSPDFFPSDLLAAALVGPSLTCYGIVASIATALKPALMAQPTCPGFLHQCIHIEFGNKEFGHLDTVEIMEF